MVRFALALTIFALAGPAGGATQDCGGREPGYAAALCLYHAGELDEAAEIFAEIVEADLPRPETLKSRYFLARTRMRQKRWKEASEEWIVIYSLSPAFYKEWSCDFLLGESRRGMGLE